MKPKNLPIDLSQDEIKAILKEWAQREYPNATVAAVTLTTHEYGDCMDRPIGHAVSASVRLTPAKE